jgi:hypothetical protein
MNSHTEQPSAAAGSAQRLCRAAKIVNGLVLIGLAAWFFVAPGVLIVRALRDPALAGPGIPRLAWSLHRHLTPRVERWARERVAAGTAAHLNLYDVPSTEWPIFTCVFYLWSTESLQRAWEADPSRSRTAPAVYAAGAVDAATDLVLDPAHHTWVKTHWGEDYLHRENVFFRSLLIAALTAREELRRDGAHRDLLRDQADTLAADLDASPHGWLNDYPMECYPIDVFAAVAIVRRADAVLGTDHRAFADRAMRGFEGERLDPLGLIPYEGLPETGARLGPSRGVGNSWVLNFAPELDPQRASAWYAAYEKHFWQRRILGSGWREFPRGWPRREWGFDVDAGPILAGYSPAANAFGLAAARASGRFDHARVLASQILPACWPLPGGGTLGTRLLSDRRHAPYLGQAGILYFLTRQPAPGMTVRTGGRLPGLFYVGLIFYFGIGALIIAGAARDLRRARAVGSARAVPAPRLQLAAWAILLVAAAALVLTGHAGPALIGFLLALCLPRFRTA